LFKSKMLKLFVYFSCKEIAVWQILFRIKEYQLLLL